MYMQQHSIENIIQQIKDHPDNAKFNKLGYSPIVNLTTKSKIILVSQAPSFMAQLTDKPWTDISGKVLQNWLGVTAETFYNRDNFAILPMDFYYPGKASTGDLPPRANFTPLWHSQLLSLMPNVQLMVLIGRYAQKYYLKCSSKSTLTGTVQAYGEYLPAYFPIVHPSPLNNRWHIKNPWFTEQVVPKLQTIIQKILDTSN